jgi:hypothetical protein
LLAEELAVNQQFLRRFIEPARALTGTDPVSDDVTAVVRLNVWDDGGPSCVATDGGENDIDVAVTVGSHTMRVLIEDKVWAVFQPDQCERYRRRADSRGDTAVLVAPNAPGVRVALVVGEAEPHCPESRPSRTRQCRRRRPTEDRTRQTGRWRTPGVERALAELERCA